jgi:hypothetical protein
MVLYTIFVRHAKAIYRFFIERFIVMNTAESRGGRRVSGFVRN